MIASANDFVLSGQAVTPTLLWIGTGSVEVFAVASLITMTLILLTLTAGESLPEGSDLPPEDAQT